MKVAVLMGGNSSEREVSLDTGQAILEALRNIGWEAVSCPYKGDLQSVIPVLKSADVVFNALHGGEGENGGVQRILEENGIRYTGSGPEASSLAMDKRRTKLLLQQNFIPTPAWFHLGADAKGRMDPDQAGGLNFPLVVKPNADGSTMGVSLVTKPGEFESAVRLAKEFGQEVIVEEYIPGREVTVVIVDHRALPIVEIIPSHELYDYACKYTRGMSRYVCPADLPGELTRDISSAAETTAELMDCRHYCRVDFRLNPEGEFFCLEVNSLPGFTSTSLVPRAAKAAGISFEELIRNIIDQALHE